MISAVRDRWHNLPQDAREIYILVVKWTIFLLAMLILTSGFAVIEVTLLDQTSASDTARAELKAERAYERVKDAKFTALAGNLEDDVAKLLSNQVQMSLRQASEDLRTRHLVAFVRAHPGAPIPASLLVPAPVPVLQKVTTNSSGKKAVHPKAQKGKR